jgi:predicted DsbA family dithiol-disulfide isomerase
MADATDTVEDRRRSVPVPVPVPGPTLEIEVGFDFICPWCLIGKRNLEAALRTLAARHPEVCVRIRWRPHPLIPQTPVGGLPFAEFYRQRLGSAEAVVRRQAQVQEAARRAGAAIAFERIRVLSSTLAAHRLALQAQREEANGGAQAAAVVEALFHEYFVCGHDIGEPSVLRAVAARCGVVGDPDASPLPAPSRAIHGVPFFRFGGAISLEGAQPPEILLDALERALSLRGRSSGR